MRGLAYPRQILILPFPIYTHLTVICSKIKYSYIQNYNVELQIKKLLGE